MKDIEAIQNLASIMEDEARMPRSTWKPQWFASPVVLPEKKLGKLSIVHTIYKPGDKMYIVSMREAILSGTAPVNVTPKEPLRVHELREQGQGTWMSDLPCELNQMAEGTVGAHGRVLVGGLGLGILPGMLRDNRRLLGVRSITVVERNPDVIALCKQRGYEVVCADIRTYLTVTKEKYDSVLLDTWHGQGESTYWNEVLPLQRIVRNRWGKVHMWCWKEREMWGQAYRSLRMHHRHWVHPKLPPFMSHEQVLDFLSNVGLPDWEKQYGGALTMVNKKQRKAVQS